MDSAVSKALAAVKANPPDEFSPLPWQDGNGEVLAADTSPVCEATFLDAAHIAAAVNAAPVLAAEVERLTAQLEAARVAVEELWTECRHDCACVNLPGRDCDCGAAITIELRRAVGLEG